MKPTTQTLNLPRQAVTKDRQTETIELAKTRPAESALNGKKPPSYFAPFATKLKLDSVVAEVSAEEVAVNAEAVVANVEAAVADKIERIVG